MFTIEVDAAKTLFRVRMAGFMTADEVMAFSAQEQALAAEMGWVSGAFLLLIDTSDCLIQSQEVVAAFTRIVLASPLKAKRIAVARGNSLTRMQARRIVTVRDDTAIFATIEEAEAWIMTGDGPNRLRA